MPGHGRTRPYVSHFLALIEDIKDVPRKALLPIRAVCLSAACPNHAGQEREKSLSAFKAVPQRASYPG